MRMLQGYGLWPTLVLALVLTVKSLSCLAQACCPTVLAALWCLVAFL